MYKGCILFNLIFGGICMEAKTPRQLAEERAAAAGKQVSSCAAAHKNSVRNIDLVTIGEDTVVTVPEDFKLFEMPITGSTQTYLVFIDTTGIQVPLGPLTRGAKPLDGSEYKKPSGGVVMECQKYSTYDEFLAANKGAHWLFKKVNPYEVMGRGEPYTAKVWTIVYCKADGTEVASLEESLASNKAG